MNRQRLLAAWRHYYTEIKRSERVVIARLIRERVSVIEGRMVALARSPGRHKHGFNKDSLVMALGMSLGVHKQLLWWLTSDPRGVTLKGGGGV